MMTLTKPLVSTFFLSYFLLGAAMSQFAFAQENVTRNPGAESAKLDGDDRLKDGLYEEAIEAYNRAIRIEENDYGQASIGLGKAYLGLEEYKEAQRAFNDAVTSLLPGVDDILIAEANNGFGEAALELGDLQSAVLKFTEAVKVDRRNSVYLLNQAEAYLKGGAAAESEKILDRAIEAQPEELARAYNLRGQARGRQKNFEKAQADFAEAIQRDPTDKEFYLNSGLYYQAEENYPKAVEAFTLAMQAHAKALENMDEAEAEKEPPYIEPLGARASAMLELGKGAPADHKKQAYQAVIADCNQGLELVPDNPNFLFTRGVALRLSDELVPAIASFSRVLELQPQAAEAYLRRGIVWYYLDDLELALADFGEAARINYQDVRPDMWRGLTLVKQDKLRDAIVAYSEALIRNRSYGPAYNNRGLAYMHLGEYDQAIKDFNNAIRSNPSDASAYLRRGIAYQQMGQNEKAAASIAASVGHNPTSPENHRKLAELYRILNRPELAEKHLAHADQLDKTGVLDSQPAAGASSGAGATGAMPTVPSFLDGLNSTGEAATPGGLPATGGATTPDGAGLAPLGGSIAPGPTAETPGAEGDVSGGLGDAFKSTTPEAPTSEGDSSKSDADDSSGLFGELFPE